MARRRSRRRRQRDNYLIARPSGLLPASALPRSSRGVRPEDRRLHHPGWRHPRTLTREARLAVQPRKRKVARGVMATLPARTMFVSKKTNICVRRKERKQVIHAIGAAGRTSSRRRRNIWSNVKC